MKNRLILKKLFHYEKSYFIINLLFIVLFSIIKLMKSPLMGITVKEVSNKSEMNLLWIISLNILYFIVFSLVRIFQSYYSELVEARTFNRLQSLVFDKIINEDVGRYDKKYKTSKIISLFINEIKILVNNYIMAMFDLFYLIISFILGIMYLFSIHYLFLSFILILLLPISSYSKKYMKKITISQKKLNESIQKIVSKLENNFNNFFVIKFFLKEEFFQKNFEKINDENRIIRLKNGLTRQKIININDVLGILLTVGCNILGILLIYFNKINLSDIIEVNIAIPFITSPIFSYTKIINSIGSTKSIRYEIEAILNDYENNSDKKIELNEIENIKFNNVSYGYSNKFLLTNININFEKNKKYLILGESGIGKSSLIKLILKIKEDYSGTIEINDFNINNIYEKEIFKKIGVLSQDSSIINDSLVNNVTFYEKFANEKFDKVLSELALEELYNSRKNDFEIDGKNFSGGQIKRINLARILYRNTKVLILDEPFSSLDSKLGKEIEKHLLNRDVLLINISHKIFEENIFKYDQVIEFSKNGIKKYNPLEYLNNNSIEKIR